MRFLQGLAMRGDQVLVVFAIWCAIAAMGNSTRRDHCRCVDSSAACWPAKEEWDAFNVAVGGRLIAPKPTGRPCHKPYSDAALCQRIRENYFDSYLRADNAGSMQFENWEDDGERTCSMNAPTSSPCHQGQVPVQGVQVEAISDVQEAIKFASRHNLRVVVKTSGHDLLGRSTAAGSFLIWMHKLKNLTIHESFAACGRPGTPAVTVVGGVSWGEVYDALNSTPYIVLGAMSRTVGAAGGYAQSGGHGALCPSLGLAVDSILEIELVTADGKFRLVNACNEPDLFFALRGGGGGTFGVVISVTYKLHKTPTNLVGVYIVLQAPNATSWSPTTQEEILTEWSRAALILDSSQWGGFWTFGATLFAGVFLSPSTEAIANATLTPILQTLTVIPNLTSSVSIFPVSTFQEWHHSIYATIYPKTYTDYTGGRALLGTRIIPLSALHRNPRRVAQTLLAAQNSSTASPSLGSMLTGPGVRNGDPHSETSVTPAWREGAWLVGIAGQWSWNATSGEKRKVRREVQAFARLLQEAYPESGTYFNEACVDEAEWQRSFWGMENYARLLATKLRVDPRGLFVCRKCVGSELWDDSGNCRRGF